MRIYTLVTDETRVEYLFLQASNKTRWPIVNLGTTKYWSGWTSRMKAYRDAAARDASDGVPMTIFVDGYDVLLHPDAEARLEAFTSRLKDHDIVVGAERYLGPKFTNIGSYHDSMPDAEKATMHETGERWAQMGVVAGKPWALADMYDWILKQGYTDDQKGLGAYMNHVKWPKVGLDVSNQLVTNIWVHPWKPSHAYDFTRPHERRSIFLHFPGLCNKIGLSYQFNEAIHAFVGIRVGLLNRRNVAGLAILFGFLFVAILIRRFM